MQVDRLSDKMTHIIMMISGLGSEANDCIQGLEEPHRPI